MCPANILVFYFSVIRRDIDLKFIQNTYGIVLNAINHINLHRSTVKVTGTVRSFLKVQSYHKKMSHRILFPKTPVTMKEITSQKIGQYLTSTCKTPIPKLLFLIKS